MAAPTSYTEITLASFMLAALSSVATAMGWTALADVQEAINDTLLAYGVTDIIQATDIKKLRALAKVAVWQQVAAATAGDYDFSADGGSYSRSQLHEMAVDALGLAQTAASVYDTDYQMGLVRVEWKNDPYSAADPEDSTI
jgi:hypothetical protein